MFSNKQYKINADGTYGGAEDSESDIKVDISSYTAPSGYTFISPDDESHVWNGTSWVEPPEIYEPTLDELKEAKCALIRSESDMRVAQLREWYSQGEIETFSQQYSGALYILDGNLPAGNAVFVVSLLAARIGREPSAGERDTFANLIIANYNAAKTLIVEIVGLQQNLELRVRGCTTSQEVEAIPVWE